MFDAPDSITLIVFSPGAFVVSQSSWPERKEAEMKETHLNQLELARRAISPRSVAPACNRL